MSTSYRAFASPRPTNPLICGSSSMIRIRDGVESDKPEPGQAGLDDAGLCPGVRETLVRESPVLQASRAAVIAPSIVTRIGRTAKLKASGMRAFSSPQSATTGSRHVVYSCGIHKSRHQD